MVTMSGADRARLHAVRSTLAALVTLAAASFAFADTTNLSGQGAAATTLADPVALSFSITRTGDLGYDAVVSYRTVDGTAQAGLDYVPLSGTVTIPAGTTAASILVDALPRLGVGGDLDFQLVLSAGGSGPSVMMGSSLGLTAPTLPAAAIAADLNNDGRLDLIGVDPASGNVLVAPNQTPFGAPMPVFFIPQNFAAPGANAVTAVDLNGDGKPDLVASSGSGNSISVLINTTAPGSPIIQFAPAQIFAVGNGPVAIAAGDVNGDGVPDIAVANAAAGSASVLVNVTSPGSATAAFSPPLNVSTGAGAGSLAMVDLNGDGKRDLVVGNVSANTLSILINQTVPGASLPTFAATQTVSAGGTPDGLVAGDLNGDGKPDLVLSSTSGNRVLVLFNATAPGAGSATFADAQPVGTGNGPAAMAVADFNNDGKPDLVVAYVTDGTTLLYANQIVPGSSAATFAAGAVLGLVGAATSVAAADFNLDGHVDLSATGASGWAMMFNQTAASATVAGFTPATNVPANSWAASVNVADFNGDGRLDLLGANLASSSVCVVLNGTEPGASQPSFGAPQAFTSGPGPRASAVADFNNDGKPDVVTANEGDDTASVLLNTTPTGSDTLSFAPRADFATGQFPFSVATADFNGDGKPDFAVLGSHDNTVSVYLNTTAPGAAVPTFAPLVSVTTAFGPSSVRTADVDGDGRPDLVVASFSERGFDVILNTTLPGSLTASFAPRQAFSLGLGSSDANVVDVNGDGLPDVVVAHQFDNAVSVLINTGAIGSSTLSFAPAQTFPAGNGPVAVAFGDFDGDGRQDLVVTNQNDNTASVLFNTTSQGTTTPTFAAAQALPTNATPIAAAVVDLNGDGRPDLVAGNSSSFSVIFNTQFLTQVSGSPATGTITHDLIFANGFD